MKKTILVLSCLIMFSGSCFAFGILTTGTTVGADKFAVQALYSSTPIKPVDGSITELGARVIYGATQDLDINAKYGMGTFASTDLDVSESSSILAIGAKYAFLKISAKDPVDLAGIVELGSTSSKSFTWGMNTFGIVVSKPVRENLTIYGTLDIVMSTMKPKGYKEQSDSGSLIGGGVKFNVNKKIDVLGEITILNVASDQYQTFAISGLYYL